MSAAATSAQARPKPAQRRGQVRIARPALCQVCPEAEERPHWPAGGCPALRKAWKPTAGNVVRCLEEGVSKFRHPPVRVLILDALTPPRNSNTSSAPSQPPSTRRCLLAIPGGRVCLVTSGRVSPRRDGIATATWTRADALSGQVPSHPPPNPSGMRHGGDHGPASPNSW